MGLGGAFISIADDATAAEANPAGLTVLIRPEISFEIKALNYKRNILFFSHQGDFPNFNPIGREFKNSVVSPAFATVVYPFKRVTLSAFRHELVNLENSFYTKGSFISTRTDGFSLFPVKSEMNFDVVNLGIAAGFKINDKLSLGASLGRSQIDANSVLARHFLEIFDESTIANKAVLQGKDNDLFFNVGFIVKPAEKFSIGGIYKKRPRFKLEHTFTVPLISLTEVKPVAFNIPSSYGVGVSYRPTDALTFSLDAVRINYSNLTDDFVITITEEAVAPKDYAVDNGTEIHLGAEYVGFWKSVGIVLRGGAFREPDHRIRWVGDANDRNDQSLVDDRLTSKFLFQAGDDNLHYTFGLGLILLKDFQIDVAGNLSDSSSEAVASFVYRF